MADPQVEIKEVRDTTGKVTLWYYVPHPTNIVGERTAHRKRFVSGIAAGADYQDESAGLYRSTPPTTIPGVKLPDGHWYKPRIPIGQQQQFPPTGAFTTVDAAHRHAYSVFTGVPAPKDADDAAYGTMDKFKAEHFNKPGGYSFEPQPGGGVNISLPDEPPREMTTEERER